MEQKASVTFDPVNKILTIAGELQPHTPSLHDALVELVSAGMSRLDGDGDFTVERDRVTYSFTFKRRIVPVQQGLPSSEDLDIAAREQEKEQEAN